MALILMLLDAADGQPYEEKGEREGELVNVVKCSNPRCITTVEQELDQVFRPVNLENHIYRCAYCESKAQVN